MVPESLVNTTADSSKCTTSLEDSTDGLNTTTRWIIGRRLAAGKSIWIVLTNLRAHVEPGFERTGDGGWRWPDSPVPSFHFPNHDSVGSCGNREYKKKDRSDHLDGDRQFALERVNEAETPSLVLGIIQLIFGGLIPGILLIVAYVKIKASLHRGNGIPLGEK